jgi:hypothetical protein
LLASLSSIFTATDCEHAANSPPNKDQESLGSPTKTWFEWNDQSRETSNHKLNKPSLVSTPKLSSISIGTLFPTFILLPCTRSWIVALHGSMSDALQNLALTKVSARQQSFFS